MNEKLLEAIISISKAQNTELNAISILLDMTKKLTESLKEVREALDYLTGKPNTDDLDYTAEVMANDDAGLN